MSSELLAIDIVDRDPADHPDGVPFEIAGEVCIPGIATDDYESIFEEQTVVKKLDVVDGVKSAYALHERIFVFKTGVRLDMFLYCRTNYLCSCTWQCNKREV